MKRTIKLGELCEFINGGAWTDKEYVSEGIPVLKVSNCKLQGFDLSSLNYLPYSAEEKYKLHKLDLYDVIVTTVGSHPTLVESAAGRAFVVNKEIKNFYLNQNAVCIRTKNNKVLNQRYLSYLAKSVNFKNYIQMRGRGAANQMRIAIGTIKDFEFLLPGIETQNKIASILSAYDDLIENNQKQIKLLEEAAQRLYKEWFVDLRFPGYKEVEIIDGLPVGWEWKKIGEVCETYGGGTPSTKESSYYNNGNLLWVTPTDITRNNSLVLLDTEKKITEEGLKNSSARMVPEESILMTSRASVGYFGICERSVCTNQGFISCVPIKEYFQMYLLYNLLNRVEEIRQKAGGSTYLEISKKAFRDFNIMLPNVEVLKSFQETEYKMFEETRSLAKKIVCLKEARERLLPKLMSGEVEV